MIIRILVGSASDDCHLGAENDGNDFYCCWCQQIKHFPSGIESNEVC